MSRSVQKFAVTPLSGRSAGPRFPIKAFCHFRQPILPCIVVTLLEEDGHLVGESFVPFFVRQLSCLTQ
jgi:hypothetical protein